MTDKQALTQRNLILLNVSILPVQVQKIGMNKDDNVYEIANDFIDKHDLNPDFLETIANWLENEIEKIDPKM